MKYYLVKKNISKDILDNYNYLRVYSGYSYIKNDYVLVYLGELHVHNDEQYLIYHEDDIYLSLIAERTYAAGSENAHFNGRLQIELQKIK